MKGQAVRSTLFLHGQARSLLRRKRQALIERERERERETKTNDTERQTEKMST